MFTRLKYIEPNKWYHRLYNRYCLWQVNRQRQLYTDPANVSVLEPLFVTGFFRSGTSFTTRLLSVLGVDLGPPRHLLQAKYKRADLNPDGFFENYLFMETSLYAFHKLNAWGHLPPPAELVKQLVFDENDRKAFAGFTLCGVYDDRISNVQKMEVLKHYDLLALDTYLEKNFRPPFAVKNPHFAVLTPFLLKKWPHAKLLVCFRTPSAAIASAARITPELTEQVYLRYYSDLLSLPAEQAVFLSYDHLLANPHASLHQLCAGLQLPEQNIDAAAKLVNPDLHRYKQTGDPSTKEVRDLYTQLMARAINTAHV